jgi:hypothetical protein
MIGIKKRNMLAIAAGVLISPALMAAELDLGKHWVGSSWLGLTGAGDEVTTGYISVQLGAEYAVGDKIRLDFSGGTVIGGSFPSSVVVDCIPETALNANDGLAGVTWGRLNFDADHVTWRVTEIDSATCAGATSTDGVVVQFADNFVADFDAPAVLAANGVTVSFSAETGAGDALDSGGTNRSDSTIDVRSEFDYTVNPVFSGTIDVNTNRTTLIPGPWDFADLTKDGLDFSDGPYVASTRVNIGNADVTWSGDFSWIVDADENTAGIQPQPNVVFLNCVSTTVTATSIAGTNCSPFITRLFLDPSQNSDAGSLVTLSPTTYSVTIDQDYSAVIGGLRDGNITATFAAGAWDLNGFQSEVAYMPYQTGIGQIIYIANRSSQDGAITVDWIDQNGNGDSFDAGIVAAGSTRALADAIKAGLPAEQRRLALTITANVPACDAQLNAQYNVSGDRAFSVASDNCPVETEHD